VGYLAVRQILEQGQVTSRPPTFPREDIVTVVMMVVRYTRTSKLRVNRPSLHTLGRQAHAQRGCTAITTVARIISQHRSQVTRLNRPRKLRTGTGGTSWPIY